MLHPEHLDHLCRLPNFPEEAGGKLSLDLLLDALHAFDRRRDLRVDLLLALLELDDHPLELGNRLLLEAISDTRPGVDDGKDLLLNDLLDLPLDLLDDRMVGRIGLEAKA